MKATNQVHAAALGYGRLGLRVIPLEPRSKIPAIARWNFRASSEAAQIGRWFGDEPDRNVGILTGGGIFALDVDGERGMDSIDEWAGWRPWPRSAMAETGGGYHYLFRSTARIPSLVGVRPSLDVRGEGGYIVVGPSIHPETGLEYNWIVHPSEVVAEAPGWLVDRLKRDRPRPAAATATPEFERDGDAEGLATEIIERFPVASTGRRNSVMVKAACSLLGRGYSPETASAALERWWTFHHGLGTISTDPRHAPRAISSTIRSIMGSGTLERTGGGRHRANMLGPGAGGTGGPILNTNRVTFRVRELDRIFIEALAVRMSYARSLAPSGTLKATFDQVCDVVEGRCGRRLNPNQVERLKRKYVTRPGRPASVRELVRQVVTGRPGVPSEFEVAELRDLFPGVVL